MKDGTSVAGALYEVDANLNATLRGATQTLRNGTQRRYESAYVNGSGVLYVLFPARCDPVRSLDRYLDAQERVARTQTRSKRAAPVARGRGPAPTRWPTSSRPSPGRCGCLWRHADEVTVRRLWPFTVRGTGALILAVGCLIAANELGLVELLYFGVLLIAVLVAAVLSLPTMSLTSTPKPSCATRARREGLRLEASGV